MSTRTLSYGVSTFFINAKVATINGLKKLRKPPSWLLMFLVIAFRIIPLLSKDLIIFALSFISLFVNVNFS